MLTLWPCALDQFHPGPGLDFPLSRMGTITTIHIQFIPKDTHVKAQGQPQHQLLNLRSNSHILPFDSLIELSTSYLVEL